MPTTPKGLPYPAATDPPNGPLQIQQLAEAVDSALTFAVEIPNAADLNTYTTPGVYVQSSQAEAMAGSNYPAAAIGLLEVFKNVAGDKLWQRYTTLGGTPPMLMYARWFNISAWSTWKTLYSDHDWQNITKAAAVTAGTLKYRVLNQVVHVFVNATAATTSGSILRLDSGGLPAAYWPSASVFGAGNFSGFPGNVFVGNGGDVSALQNSGAGRASVAGTVSYPLGA